MLALLSDLHFCDGTALSEHEKAQVHRRMQRIEDVRPLLASLKWAYYEADCLHADVGVEKAQEVQIVLDETVKSLVESFRALDFYRAWHDKHVRLLPFEAPQKLRAVFDGLSVVNVDTVGKMALLFEQAMSRVERLVAGHDPYREGAALEDLHHVGHKGMRYVVYGHTHRPAQAALRASSKTEDSYLNSTAGATVIIVASTSTTGSAWGSVRAGVDAGGGCGSDCRRALLHSAG